MKLHSIIAAVRDRGFAILERHLDDGALARVRASHSNIVAEVDPGNIARSSSNSRAYLPAQNAELDGLYCNPVLLSIASSVMGAPFKLSGFLSRTVHPGAQAQGLHIDIARKGDAPALFGFIYMLDDFRVNNGATRFIPGSHRGSSITDCVVAVAPAGSLLVYDGSTLHGFSDSTSHSDRRSIQGAFVSRSTPSVVDHPTHLGRNDLARYLLGEPQQAASYVDISHVTSAIEASWDHRTAYRGVTQAGNPAFGQCYPTARVVQWFYPDFEIACGDVWMGDRIECHFWNVRNLGGEAEKIDLSWGQFPAGSIVRKFKVLDRTTLGDSPATVERCALLLQRVLSHLAERQLLETISS